MSGLIAMADLWTEDPLPVPNTGPAFALTLRRRPPMPPPKARVIVTPRHVLPVNPLALALRAIKEHR